MHIRPLYSRVSEQDQKDAYFTSAYILLRFNKQIQHHPHASAFALTPFKHTFVAKKDQAFPCTVCLSVKLLFGRRGQGGGEGGPSFPSGT